jgi:hypothetical protein
MRKLFVLLFTTGVVLCTLATANAAEVLKVTVPFDFVVDGNTLPAATYTIREPLPNNKDTIGFQTRGVGVFAQGTVLEPSITGTKLVFHQVGGQYFLSDVVQPDGSLHFAVSQRERQLAQEADRQSITTISAN